MLPMFVLFCFNKFFILQVLDLQDNCKDKTESSQILSTQFPLLLTSYIHMVHLQQLTNINALLTICRFP